MTAQQPLARIWQDFDERYHWILNHLEDVFDNFGDYKPEGDFRTAVFDRVWDAVDMGEHNLAEIIRIHLGQDALTKSAEELMSMPIAGVILPAVFCIRSRIADDGGDRELAWAYLSEASLLAGMLLAGKRVHGLVVEAQDQGKLVLSNEGNKAKRKASDRFAAEAYRLVRKKMPAGAKWPKIIDAVLEIQADMLLFSRQQNIRAAPSNIQRRLSEVLSQMPDAAEVFQNKGS
ncbi:hypothetical protein [Burkholderia vietnamiensis]|uniref:hypothetical protein n=1 Tax=Burkholderia vietnamiensis TaxID=60552 RepID=UPI00075E2DB0|nr:hypothetical protein [Burkholderia vietnamiensis]KVE72449.1 hypothetical protein WI98_01045 [Burkholderia vietnamiensis]